MKATRKKMDIITCDYAAGFFVIIIQKQAKDIHNISLISSKLGKTSRVTFLQFNVGL